MEAEALIKAIGEPMRYQILRLLLERKHCVRSLSRQLGVSESAISQHLKVMRDVGLVSGEKYGHHTHYSPLPEAMELLAQTFEEMCRQSRALDRSSTVCQCAWKAGEKA